MTHKACVCDIVAILPNVKSMYIHSRLKRNEVRLNTVLEKKNKEMKKKKKQQPRLTTKDESERRRRTRSGEAGSGSSTCPPALPHRQQHNAAHLSPLIPTPAAVKRSEEGGREAGVWGVAPVNSPIKIIIKLSGKKKKEKKKITLKRRRQRQAAARSRSCDSRWRGGDLAVRTHSSA